jgi:XTP/dITP diphosphohydrolase
MHEATMILAPLGYEVIQKDVGYPEIQTDSLEEVARFGIEYLKSKLDHPFILEDAGLFIDALSGFPGVFSSYVYHTIGLDGILALLQDVTNNERTAVFRSVFAYGTSQGECELFIGECPGIISIEKKGAKGFGYDPIFIPEKKAKTFAEMETKEKNNFSHRGKSLDKLVQYLKTLDI